MPACQLDSCRSPGDVSDFLLCNGKTGADYLTWVSQFVSTNRHKVFPLNNPAGATLRIAGVEDTIYSENHGEVNGWGKFYLPNIVKMQVVGIVEGTSCPYEQLVLMTCEDRKLYAYDEEELHEVASSPKQLCERGIEYPASKSYYKGEAFKDMTKEDWAKVRQGPVGRRLDQEQHQLVTSRKSRFMENLKISRQKRSITS